MTQLRLILFLTIFSIFISSCIQNPTYSEHSDSIQTSPQALPTNNTIDFSADVYTCDAKEYDLAETNLLIGDAVRVQMLNQDQVEVEMWIYGPDRVAFEQNQPLPTRPLDGYDTSELPTTYEKYAYNLKTKQMKQIPPPVLPSYMDLCTRDCEKQILDESPDQKWQLVLLRSTTTDYLNGLWLVQRNGYRKLIAPSRSQEWWRLPSKVQWRWQTNSEGLFIRPRALETEIKDIPLYIRLSMPPAYARPVDGIPLPSLVWDHKTFPIDDDAILLKASGSIVSNDNSSKLQQWFIFETETGNLRKASAQDFITYTKYIYESDSDNLNKLLSVEKWTIDKQNEWIAAHPDDDIWDTLADQAFFADPFQSEGGLIMIPTYEYRTKTLTVNYCTIMDL